MHTATYLKLLIKLLQFQCSRPSHLAIISLEAIQLPFTQVFQLLCELFYFQHRGLKLLLLLLEHITDVLNLSC